MKNKKTKKIKFKLWIELISTICIALIVYFIIDILFEDEIAISLSKINYRLYYWIVHNRELAEYITFVIIAMFVSYIFISKYVNTTNEVYNSLEKILKEDNEKIKIKNDEYQFGEKLNEIKYNYIISKNNQREAEQKKNDLIMYMAHDLKTPLTSIIGYLTLLTEEQEISAKNRKKYTKIALDKSLRVEELINQFFDITRYNLHSMPINKNKIDLSFLLRQLVDECYPMLEKNNLKCKLTIPEKTIYNADGDKLARAFDNLLKNAINYSYENTIINIFMEENEEKITIKFINKGEKIPEYKLDKIFEKFYRADDSRTSKTGGARIRSCNNKRNYRIA